MPYETTGETIKTLLTMAWALPIAGVRSYGLFAGYWQREPLQLRRPHYVAVPAASGWASCLVVGLY